MNCEWTISGSGITLSFSSFATETGYDFVKVYDGSQQIGSFTGSAVPSALTASASMRIVFSSDGSVENTGFTASYMMGGSVVPPSYTPPSYTPPSYTPPSFTPPGFANPTPASNALLSGAQCNGPVSVSVSSAATTIGVNSYQNNANCAWNLSGSPQVSLIFASMSTESGYDFVRVYDGPSSSSSSSALLGSFSGSTTPASIRSTGTSLTVVFQSDSSVTGRGFEAQVST